MLLKRGKWHSKNLERLQSSQEPLTLATLVKEKKTDELKREIQQAISENKLDGFLSRSASSYIPRYVVEDSIRIQASTGVVDKVTVIKNLDISSDMIDPIIEGIVEDRNGFWDLKRRRWYSVPSAKQLLIEKLSDSDKVYAWEIMQEFGWPIDRLEKLLLLVSKDGQISGFIDRNHMINITSLISRDLILRSPRAIETFANFLQASISENSANGMPVQTVLSLFRLSQSQFDELIEHLNEEGILVTVLSENGQRLLSLTQVLERIVRYILVLEPFPIHLLSRRLSLSTEVLDDVLQKLQVVVSTGEIDSDLKFVLSEKTLKHRLREPIDIEAFSAVFGVSPAVSLRLVQTLANAHNLRLVNQDTEVIGIADMEIFCQLDGTVYEQQAFVENPRRYYECMNCRRVVCASCYEPRDSKSCPFCDNISQFILEFPRYCPSCGLTYLGVEGLQTSEKCRLCDFSPLERGWVRPISHPESAIRESVSERLNSSTGKSIPLAALAAVAGLSEELLEEEITGMILSGVIHAKIDLMQGQLNRYEADEDIQCVICQGKDDLTTRCGQCNAVVCQKCTEDLQKVNAFFCIDCSGDLQQIDST
ncbi:MAG: PCI domain-containing protein [Candidatus Heimdallarchaeota archaeon]